MDGLDRSASAADNISSPYGDLYIPGGWLDREDSSPTRKRKATFDLPAAKRSSPPRVLPSTSLLHTLAALSPIRIAQRFLTPQVLAKRELGASKLDDVSGASREHPSEISTRSRSPEQITNERQKTRDIAQSTACQNQSLNTFTPSNTISGRFPFPSSSSQLRVANSVSGLMDVSRMSEQRRSSVSNITSSFAEQRRARKAAFARAAHLAVKQPQHDHGQDHEIFAQGEELINEASNNREALYPMISGRQPRRFTFHDRRKPILTSISLTPVQQNNQGSTSNPPSPSLQLCNELQASMTPIIPESDGRSGFVSELWTVPRKPRDRTSKKQLLNCEPVPQPAAEDDGSLLKLENRSRQFSPPAMGRRIRPCASQTHLKDSGKTSAGSQARQMITVDVRGESDKSSLSTHPTPGSFSVQQSGEESTTIPAAKINGEIHTNHDEGGQISTLTDPREDSPPTTVKSHDDQLLDVANLSISDDFPQVIDTPKASGHSGERLKRLTRAQLRKKQLEEEALNQFEIVPLTAAWDAKVRQAVQRGHGNYASSDLARAVPEYAGRGQDNWLNDEVINGYLSLVTAHGKKNDRPNQTPSYHAFNSFFYTNLSSKGPDSVMKWSKRPKINGTNLLNVEAVFIPINTGVHWTLAVVEPKKKTITHYNSMRSAAAGVTACGLIKNWVAKELGKDFIEAEWTLVAAGESPQQTNSDDCGVFTITSARQIMLGFKPMSYRSDQMRVQRKRIVAELINNGLLKSKENPEG